MGMTKKCDNCGTVFEAVKDTERFCCKECWENFQDHDAERATLMN